MTSNKHPFTSNKLPNGPFDAELAEWIRGAALGDQESQKKIYQRNAAQIVRIVRRIVGQDHVDDVVQDFFVTLFAKISQFRFESSFETWVHRMAVNQSLQHLRKASREQERIRQYAGDGAVQSIPKDESSSREDAEVLVLARVTWYPTNGTNTQHEHATHEHGSLAVDFRNVIEFAQLEPQKAISNLVEKYDGKQLETESATKTIGYRPALFNHVPDGFQRVSTHVLNMPCCKCSATVCQRPNGTSVIVFEHKDEQPVWFGDLPSIDTQCSGTQCRIIESAGQLAVSWRQKDRQFTVVGASDVAEVSQWVETLKM